MERKAIYPVCAQILQNPENINLDNLCIASDVVKKDILLVIVQTKWLISVTKVIKINMEKGLKLEKEGIKIQKGIKVLIMEITFKKEVESLIMQITFLGKEVNKVICKIKEVKWKAMLKTSHK